MSVYLDASVLVALFFTNDPFSAKAHDYLRASPDVVIVSDFAALEFSSAVARLVRIGVLRARMARTVLAEFDGWTAQEAQASSILGADLSAATVLLRRLDLPLRTGDALHIAMARRMGAELFTFDDKMARSARALGAEVKGA